MGLQEKMKEKSSDYNYSGDLDISTRQQFSLVVFSSTEVERSTVTELVSKQQLIIFKYFDFFTRTNRLLFSLYLR